MLNHVSHSQLSMWIRCPRQWEYRYVKNVKSLSSGALIEGSCYHDTLEFNLCRIDLETDTGLIVDHKTSARKYSQIDVDYDIQASAEAFVLNRPIIFENHVAVKTARPLIQILGTTRTIDDIEWWLGMASRVVIQMKTGVAPPKCTDAFGKAGWWCSAKFCDNFEDCRGKLRKR